ncbi:MAG TPA: hypothetical protein VGB91_00060 [Rhizomicrobium sp.]
MIEGRIGIAAAALASSVLFGARSVPAATLRVGEPASCPMVLSPEPFPWTLRTTEQFRAGRAQLVANGAVFRALRECLTAALAVLRADWKATGRPPNDDVEQGVAGRIRETILLRAMVLKRFNDAVIRRGQAGFPNWIMPQWPASQRSCTCCPRSCKGRPWHRTDWR